MAPLPTGTVTFMFTDIEGSTHLLQELGDGYADLLEGHEAVVRHALAAHDGAEVDTQGDAFFAAFASARDAVAAAEEMQRELARTAIRVRIGLHTGEAERRGERYVGVDVHRAARICSAAHGGQVLMSQPTRDLGGAETRDLGEHRLKDLLAPQRLFQLVAPGLPDAFPPPRTLERSRTNLPVQATLLVGRARELEEAQALLTRRGNRLLTLTGPGGAGKTRLALQLAAELLDSFDDGVFFVDLSGLRDAALVLPAIARAVGLDETQNAPVAERLSDLLAARRTLVVIDNVEQVVESAPDVVRLLAACPDLQMIATGRAALHVASEQEYPVPPLPEDAAVELFAERARAVRPGFDLDGQRRAIVEICSRLDRLPLAIELAAARVKLLPPAKLLERLDLALLTSGARDAPQRHQTLRATIDWSYELLDESERELLARLSVFAAGFTLEGAETVGEASLDSLASLVENSLVAVRETDDGEPSFALLETVRDYAHEQLVERGEVDTFGRAHAEYVLRSLESAGYRRSGPGVLPTNVARDFENIRAARAWFEAAGDAERELRLAINAFWAIWRIGGTAEVCGWLVAALERSDGIDRGVLADAHGSVALAAHNLGDGASSRRHAERSLALARELGDKLRIEWGLRVSSFTEKDLDERRRLLGECDALLRELGATEQLGWIKLQEAATFELEGDWHQAQVRYGEGAAIFDRHGLAWEATNARLMQAALLVEGDPDAAEPLAEEALRASATRGSVLSTAEALAVLAGVRSATDAVTAARLAAATRAVFDRETLGRDARIAYALELAERAAKEELGDRFDLESGVGRALSLDEAVALALEPR